MAWNGKSFTGIFLVGGRGNSFAEPMQDWLCDALKLKYGYSVTAKCIELESSNTIEIFADGENADIIADIKVGSRVELVLRTVYLTAIDCDNYDHLSPGGYFIFEVLKILSVSPGAQDIQIPF